MTRQSEPSKPKCKEPVVWAWKVQEIATTGTKKAIQAIILDEHPSIKSASWEVQYSNIIQDALRTDPMVQREVYERTAHFIDREKATARERAEAKLLTWLRIYADYP
jgi:hypothetical protein